MRTLSRSDLLADMIKCKCCNGDMIQVRSKDGGHYGCCNARTKCCTNTQLIPKQQVEAIILNDLKAKFLSQDVSENRSYYVAHTSIQTLALL